MKKIIIFLIIVLNFNLATSQNIKLDTLIGKNGIIKRFSPKEISKGQKLSFNLKLNYSMKNKSGSEQEVAVYMNTKYGYIGMIPSNGQGTTFDPDSKNFKLMVLSNAKQSFMFTTSNKGKKSMMAIPMMPQNQFKFDDVTIKKENTASKKSTNLSIDGYAYNNSKTDVKDKVVMYLSDAALAGNVNYQNQLCYAGIGFYSINGKTVLNMSIESNDTKITLNKVEGVNVYLKTADFKAEESGMTNEMMQEILKKVKKQ